jgi:hypothetical protein
LIANYEFGKLSIAKAQRLSNHLGFKNAIRRPMTISEICNQQDKEFDTGTVKVLGFRRNVESELTEALTE